MGAGTENDPGLWETNNMASKQLRGGMSCASGYRTTASVLKRYKRAGLPATLSNRSCTLPCCDIHYL
jgi:hypothetical protein